MKNADDQTPSEDILSDESDLGPEPDWLSDAGVEDDPEALEAPEPSEPNPESAPESGPVIDLPAETDRSEVTQAPLEPTEEIVTPPLQDSEPLFESGPATAEEVESSYIGVPLTRAEEESEKQAQATAEPPRPWLWAAVPLILLLVLGGLAWFGTTQTLNHVATWNAIRIEHPPLLPARWAMTIWWAVLPLMAVFYIYAFLPNGREATRIKITGPLTAIATVATGLWLFAQHWHWELVGFIGIAVAAVSLLASYLLVTLGPGIKNLRQRFLAVAPLSAALGYSVMLTILAWQSYSTQPFGERGTSVLFGVVMLIVAAILAFFLRDGLFALIIAIWFAGVVHQQWGDDALISLVAAVVTVLSLILAGLGTLLASESHKPSLTTSLETRRGRTSFFRRKEKAPSEELP